MRRKLASSVTGFIRNMGPATNQSVNKREMKHRSPHAQEYAPAPCCWVSAAAAANPEYESTGPKQSQRTIRPKENKVEPTVTHSIGRKLRGCSNIAAIELGIHWWQQNLQPESKIRCLGHPEGHCELDHMAHLMQRMLMLLGRPQRPSCVLKGANQRSG